MSAELLHALELEKRGINKIFWGAIKQALISLIKEFWFSSEWRL